jgi:hypothetical protein
MESSLYLPFKPAHPAERRSIGHYNGKAGSYSPMRVKLWSDFIAGNEVNPVFFIAN